MCRQQKVLVSFLRQNLGRLCKQEKTRGQATNPGGLHNELILGRILIGCYIQTVVNYEDKSESNHKPHP